jgi:hypothetical protein
VRVALLNERGKPLPGFSLEDCEPIQGNSVRYVVAWQDSADLQHHAGQTVRLQFELCHARLFAFQFTSSSPKP